MNEVTSYQFDVLRELINIGTGRAAGLLNQMTDEHVTLQVPLVEMYPTKDLITNEIFPRDEKLVVVQLEFIGSICGIAVLLFPSDHARTLVRNILGCEEITGDMDAMRIGTLQEIGNIVLNGVMGSMANMLKGHVSYVPPVYYEDYFENIVKSGIKVDGEMVMLVMTDFGLGKEHLSGKIALFFRLESFESILQAIDEMSKWD